MQFPDQAGWPGAEGQGISRRFVNANGLRFELAVAGPANSDKLAICLHGFPELAYSWRFQMPTLAAKGWRVWAPNMRGYGESEKPAGVGNYALNHLIQDVAALIDAAKAENPAREVMLVAHDWGAIVAWHFAIHMPRPIKRLVIMNVPHPKVAEREIFKSRQFWKSWYIFFFQLPWLPEFVLKRGGGKRIRQAFSKMALDQTNFGDADLDVYAGAALRTGSMTAMVNYYRALLRTPDVKQTGEARVIIPTLMIWGEADTALNIHCTEGTEEWVPRLTLKRLPGVSHWVQQEAPEKVNAILADWLK